MSDSDMKEVHLDDRPSIDESRSASIDDMGRSSVSDGRGSIEGTTNEQENPHAIGNYAQLDQESSKPTLQRNPYISLLFFNRRFLIIWMAGVLSGMGNYFSEIGKSNKQTLSRVDTLNRYCLSS